MTDEQVKTIDNALDMLLCVMRAANWEGDAAYRTGEKARALLAAGASEGQAVDCGECACLPGICDKEEALKPVGYVIPQRLQSDDPVISLYRKPEGGARKPLYTHPSAEIAALRERIAGMEKEADRYRWLKMRSSVGEQRQIMSTPWGQWDAFADAAIAKESK